MDSPRQFNELAVELFQRLRGESGVYKDFVDLLSVKDVSHYTDIPLLPIEFFKTHTIQRPTSQKAIKTFESSTTTGTGLSKRHMVNPKLYHRSIDQGFEREFGSAQNYIILGLLPSYLERQSSSLIYMVDRLMRATKHEASGFYLYNYGELAKTIERIKKKSPERKVMLWGVTFGLLDMLEKGYNFVRPDLVLETGGMKGRRKELIREELHDRLKLGFGVDKIYGEYGMTEMYSQAYGIDGRYQTPPWMQLVPVREDNPFEKRLNGSSARIGIIDLANMDACPFLLTSDLGRVLKDGSFHILGRMDHSDVRGCSQMV